MAGLDVIRSNEFSENGEVFLAKTDPAADMDTDCSVEPRESEGILASEGITEEACSNSNSEQDVLEEESGVESFSGDGELQDWSSSLNYDDLVELDLTTEQAQETLRYFCE